MSTVPDPSLPTIIQGGMGIGVSSWKLANSVAARGQMGVISGTAIDRVLACRLQEGDPDGLMRSALAAFPVPEVAARVLAAWWQPQGLETPGKYRPVPMFSIAPGRDLLELAVCAAFVEIHLAKRSGGPVGINLLEKIQLPTLPVLYGALLGGVDAVLMGAGIPREIPGHLDALTAHKPSSLRVPVQGGPTVESIFDPAVIGAQATVLKRPKFYAVISSDVLAASLFRSGGIDGFIVEGLTAGGHNAPPRGGAKAADGTPIYGPRDVADLARIRAIGLPFWLAGGRATREGLKDAWDSGAQGVQIGTAFAFCAESGLEPNIRRSVLKQAIAGKAPVITDGYASPTGFPFKLAAAEGSEGGRDASLRDRQTCTFGYLRQAYTTPEGAVGWRCPSEPVDRWAAKGGDPADTDGRRCLCHGLLSAAGHPHRNGDELELPLITAGDDLADLARFSADGSDYHADDVINAVLPAAG